MHFHFILPIFAGLLYTFAALFSKQGIAEGGGAMRITFIANMLAIPVFLPLLLLDNQPVDMTNLWAPIACGIANFGGMSLTFATIRVGDISIQTPMMGCKILIVAAMVTIFYHHPVPLPWWIAGSLAMIAIALLGKSKAAHVETSVIFKTIVLALACSLSFAICDVIMAQEAQIFGESLFLIIMIVTTALCSFAFIPFFRGSLFKIPSNAVRWIWLGAITMALEEIVLYGAIAFYGNATAMNILYSSRGIWSILLIWSVGHWFRNKEKSAGPKVMRRRLAGATLLFIAIIIVLATEPKPETEELCDVTCITES